MIDLSKLEKVKTEQELEQESQLIKSIDYLKSTDWYVIRFLETGKEVPDDIKELRAQAREIVNQ